MAGLGTYLSRLREDHGLSIDELARVTRVAPRYLEAIEREDFASLPAPVFTKGYIRAYCQAIGVPADEALTRYSESADVAVPAAAVVAPISSRPAEARRSSRGTFVLSFVLLVGFGVALFVVALLLQSGRPEIGARRAEPPAPRVESHASALPPPSAPVTPPAPPSPPEASAAASPPPTTSAAPSVAASTSAARGAASSPAPAPTVRPPEPKPAPPVENRPAPSVAEAPPLQLGSIASPYRLVARTVESTWLRVRTEDGRATEETIPAGEVREWISNRPFVLTIGNAAGIALELNGQKLPPLGGRGVVIGRLTLPPAEP